MTVDMDRAYKLCCLVRELTGVGPGYENLRGEALAELREMNEYVRKQKLKEQGKPVTPAPYGDKESPPPAQVPTGTAPHPTASTPLAEQPDPSDTNPMPEVDPNPPSTAPSVGLSTDVGGLKDKLATRNTVDGLPGPAESIDQ